MNVFLVVRVAGFIDVDLAKSLIEMVHLVVDINALRAGSNDIANIIVPDYQYKKLNGFINR